MDLIQDMANDGIASYGIANMFGNYEAREMTIVQERFSSLGDCSLDYLATCI